MKSSEIIRELTGANEVGFDFKLDDEEKDVEEKDNNDEKLIENLNVKNFGRVKKGQRTRKKFVNAYTPHYFKLICLAYLKKCEIRKEIPNIAGLLSFLGVSRSTFNSLKERIGYKKFIDWLYNYIEDKWVQELNKKNSSGVVFYLKNNYREVYKDVIDYNVRPIVPILGGLSRKKIREKKLKDLPEVSDMLEGNSTNNK